jgi:orotate phosphoribosyltransferase
VEDGRVNSDLARRLHECSHLTGSFVLRSGATSSEYFDKFQFTARPDLLRDVAKELSLLVPTDVDVLAGIQLGGVPLAAALSLETGLPAVYVRLKRKEYATRKIAEGVDVAGKTLAVIEDVVSTGGQIVLSTANLREEGAIVRYALAVVDRSIDGAPALAAAGLEYRTVFRASDLDSA